MLFLLADISLLNLTTFYLQKMNHFCCVLGTLRNREVSVMFFLFLIVKVGTSQAAKRVCLFPKTILCKKLYIELVAFLKALVANLRFTNQSNT